MDVGAFAFARDSEAAHEEEGFWSPQNLLVPDHKEEAFWTPRQRRPRDNAEESRAPTFGARGGVPRGRRGRPGGAVTSFAVHGVRGCFSSQALHLD